MNEQVDSSVFSLRWSIYLFSLICIKYWFWRVNCLLLLILPLKPQATLTYVVDLILSIQFFISFLITILFTAYNTWCCFSSIRFCRSKALLIYSWLHWWQIEELLLNGKVSHNFYISRQRQWAKDLEILRKSKS